VDPEELVTDGDLHEEPAGDNVPLTVSVSLSSGQRHQHQLGRPPPYAGHHHEEPPKGSHIGFSVAL